MHTISKHSKARAIGRCQTAFANVEGLESTKIIHPAWDAENYFSHFEGRKSDKNIFSEKAKLKLIQQPRNGRLNKDLTEYYPNANFIGKDIFIIEVQENGINVNIYYNMLVSDSPDNVTYGLFGKHCGPTGIWKISQSPTNPSSADPATWLQSAQLSAVLASANQSLTGFQNLAGSAVGNTVSEGLGAQITLDTNAAGHGWYTDATPLDNTDDFLPTSDATIWQAKPGSASEGKMDMLSVLLHEYGHALGLDHTEDSHNFMAETLQPGQRKLPTAQELQLMAQLVAELKGEMNAAEVVTANSGTDPLSGSGSDPTAPASLALMGLLALRRRPEDAAAHTSNAALSLQSPLQKLLSINPTLQNTGFTQGTAGSATQGWTVDGVVATGTNSITLKETATSQTTLSQAFVLGANDKKLSFTVDGVALNGVGGQLSAAPADAFEVALLDATTYDNLLSPAGLGWTRSDAALNLQRDVSGALLERKAAGVTSKVNLDGSTTYTLDLSGIPAGKAVLLSFDLLGFSGNNDVNGDANSSANTAPTSSHITLRNIRLSSGDELPNTAPVASNVSTTLAEDAALTVNLLAQVVDAEGDALTFNVTNTGAGAPQHGTVQLLEGGLVRYTPNANYFGPDSFTYTVSDGQNTASATVNVVVTAVNDAPTLSNLSLTLAEDGSTTFNPWVASSSLNGGVALAQDVDSTVVGSPLTVSIVTGPVHGQVVVQMDGSIRYIPNANYNGLDGFTYRVTDGELTSNIASVQLSVSAVNDAPVAGDVSASLAEDTPFTIQLVGSDVDSTVIAPTTLTYRIVTGPTHGTVSLGANGQVLYTPAANYFGPDSFTYVANDGEVDSNLATVTLNVTPVNDAPTAEAVEQTLAEDATITFSLAGKDVDTLPANLSFSVVTPAQHGVVSINTQGVATYTPYANYAGPDSFSYKVNDGQFDSAPATVVLNVTPVNDAPVALSATVSTPAGTAVNLTLQASDVDHTPAQLSFRLVTLPSRGSVTLQPDGRVVYTPQAGFSGTDTFTYVVNDGQLDSNVATATINVTAAPPPPRVINGTGARDTLVGTTQDEIFIGGSGADTLSGNGGVNTYRYLNFSDGGDTVTDFTAARDFIDFKALLISLGYVGNDPVADGWVRIIDGAAGAQVQVAPGPGYPWRTMVTLRGVQASSVNTGRDLIWR